MTESGKTPHLHHRKQGHKDKTKDEIKQYSEVTPAISFAFLSARPSTPDQFLRWLPWTAMMLSSPDVLFRSHQEKLWIQAEPFFLKVMGCLGHVIKVHGDLEPSGSYMILGSRVKLHQDLLPAAQEFMTKCATDKSAHLQLQLGRTVVVDHTGALHRVTCSPFFDAQWRQHRNGSECIQLFAQIALEDKTVVHALVSRADYSAEAIQLSLQYGSDLAQLLAQVPNSDANDKLPLEQCTAGCTMTVPADGMVFMILLSVSDGDKILYNLLTE